MRSVFSIVIGYLLLIAGCLCTFSAWSADPQVPAPDDRGRQLYSQHCFICHQLNGQGVPGTFPPLAKSDYLLEDKNRSIRTIIEGLSGEITVNGKRYAGAMPAVLIDDDDIAAVLTYVRSSWENQAEAVTADEVKAVRRRTQFRTFEALKSAAQYPPLPKAPDGFLIREVARMPSNPVRLASDGIGGPLYVLTGNNGDVWRVDPNSGAMQQLLSGNKYLEKRSNDVGGPIILVGMTMDPERRLYIVANQNNRTTLPVQNIVTVYRTTTMQNGDPINPKPWFQTNYPGNFAYLHGAEGMAFGPDGALYIANGARTDSNQPGDGKEWYGGGEMELTSSIWRVDARSEPPRMEVFARGIRNGYGLCFNSAGELFESENGPDADAPEELNFIQKGKHYGFPYRFADWTNKIHAHTPEPQPGQEFELPIANLGPDGGFDGKPIYSFDPHSSPGGLCFLGDDFPEGWRGTLLMTRFGNFIRKPKDTSGFDVLHIKLRKSTQGRYEAEVRTALFPLGRPNDILVNGKGKIYISEYGRGTNSHMPFTLPGRIIEMSVDPDR